MCELEEQRVSKSALPFRIAPISLGAQHGTVHILDYRESKKWGSHGEMRRQSQGYPPLGAIPLFHM